MRKVCVVITARPSYSRVRTVLEAAKRHPDIELQIVVAASSLLERYGSTVDYIEEDGFDVNAKVYMLLEGENLLAMAKTTGLGILELSTVFTNLKPDAVVTIADRYETMATAVAASYLNIPLVHIQGGEVTGSIDEKVRHAVTKLSDLHCVASEPARRRVLAMGEDPGSVLVTGCPSIDNAARVEMGDKLAFDPYTSYGGVGSQPPLDDGFIVVLQHPVTTQQGVAQAHVRETLYAVHESGLPTLWFWPNPDAGSDGTSKGIRAFREAEEAKTIHFFKNFKPLDFLHLLTRADCIVGNSSVAIRECSYLGVPAVNIGSRQNGRDRGHNVIDVGHDRAEILAAIATHAKKGRPARDELYGDGKAGERIAQALATAPLTVEKRNFW